MIAITWLAFILSCVLCYHYYEDDEAGWCIYYAFLSGINFTNLIYYYIMNRKLELDDYCMLAGALLFIIALLTTLI